MKPPAKSPCGSCPYRRDVPSGVWHPDEYSKLPEYDKPMLEQPKGLFGCHQNDGKACAGWVGVHDMDDNFAFRIAVSMGHIAREDIDGFLDYETSVPLFGSGQEACDHGMKEIEVPSERATRVIKKLLKVPGVRFEEEQ